MKLPDIPSSSSSTPTATATATATAVPVLRPGTAVVKSSGRSNIGREVGGARGAYTQGVDQFYASQGDTYSNPHEPILRSLIYKELCQIFPTTDSTTPPSKATTTTTATATTTTPIRVLDLAAGSGEASRAVLEWAASSYATAENVEVLAMDPFTFRLYESTMHRPCLAVSFTDIAERGIPRVNEDDTEQQLHHDVAICSFALHLAPTKSLLQAVCTQLALVCKRLLILTPHKRPHIPQHYGWTLRREVVLERVRLRSYESTFCQ